MQPPEPGRTPLEIRGLLCGVPLRIRPQFWFAAAALGIRYYADPEAGGAGYFTFWMVAVLTSVLLSAFGQALVGHWYGVRGTIALDGFGSRIVGVDALPRCRQRVAVLLAGPVVQFLLVGAIWGLTIIPFPAPLNDWGGRTPVATGAAILVRINLYWGLLSAIPLWPLTGGRIAAAVGESLLGRNGRSAAVLLSLGTTAVLSVWVVLDMSWHLDYRYDPRYLLYLEESAVLLVFCFLLWTRNFAALWPEQVPAQK